MFFALSHTLAPTSGTISPKTSGKLKTQKQTWVISLLRNFQLSNIVLQPYQSVQHVCVCVRACVCVCMHACRCMFYTVMLEPLLTSTCCVSFSVKLLTTCSIWMYIMCLILCLFKALRRRVSAWQNSIIIIIMNGRVWLSLLSLWMDACG